VTLSERVKAPVKPGAIAGTVTIYNGNEIVEEYPLPLDITVEKAGFWDFTGYVFRTLFFVE
jgi:D-alanyl-D-alanine carboxypeptidase (penicillin-binding protein 5/6)